MELQDWSRFVSLINSYQLTYVKCWVDMAAAFRKKGKQGLVRASDYKILPQNFRYKADAVRLEKRTLPGAVARYRQDYLPQLTDQRFRKNHLNWWVDELGQRTPQHLNPDNESIFPNPPNWAVN
jgi:hypothetical protein